MSERFEFHLPDLGDFETVDVIEVLVNAGDTVAVEQSLIVLESDKATMEIPAPVAGVIEELCVKVGDAVSAGAKIAVIATEDASAARAETATPRAEDAVRAEEDAAADDAPVTSAANDAPVTPDTPASSAPVESAPAPAPVARTTEEPPLPKADASLPHAGPSVRHLATELGVDLTRVTGSGRKGRITREDVQQFVKRALSGAGAASGAHAGPPVAPAPEIDFAKFGEIEHQPRTRIQKLSAANLHRSWVTAPHVTQFDEADITELDRFRKAQKAAASARGVKLTFLPFLVKACAAALREFPHFNASLAGDGEQLIVKRYCHIGVAVDTPNGLVVPVLRDADQKGLLALAQELDDLSARARERKLRPADLQGGSFSISSLGGIGGTFFTPIVNHPEVAILGVSRMQWKPVYEDGAFTPRLMLPLSLSYDHRVIDGADAARFTRRLSELLSDLRLTLL